LKIINNDFNLTIAISGGGRIAAADYLDLAKKLGAQLTFENPFVKEELLT